jgi:hypothetical protein
VSRTLNGVGSSLEGFIGDNPFGISRLEYLSKPLLRYHEQSPLLDVDVRHYLKEEADYQIPFTPEKRSVGNAG